MLYVILKLPYMSERTKHRLSDEAGAVRAVPYLVHRRISILGVQASWGVSRKQRVNTPRSFKGGKNLA